MLIVHLVEYINARDLHSFSEMGLFLCLWIIFSKNSCKGPSRPLELKQIRMEKRGLRMNKKLSYTVGVISLILFLILALIVKMKYMHGPIPVLDLAVQKFAGDLQGVSWLVALASLIATLLGDAGGAVVGLIIIVALYFVFKQRVAAIWLAFNIVIAVGGNTVLKILIGRVRPETYRLPAFAHESGMSFASGHSVFATILFGTLFLIIVQTVRSQSAKVISGILAVGLIGLTMFSRVLIGVHYPSDTIGGLLIGITVLALTYPTYVNYLRRN